MCISVFELWHCFAKGLHTCSGNLHNRGCYRTGYCKTVNLHVGLYTPATNICLGQHFSPWFSCKNPLTLFYFTNWKFLTFIYLFIFLILNCGRQTGAKCRQVWVKGYLQMFLSNCGELLEMFAPCIWKEDMVLMDLGNTSDQTILCQYVCVLSPARKETSWCFCQNGVNFLRCFALLEKKLDDSSRLDVVEIARVPYVLPSLFPSWSG